MYVTPARYLKAGDKSPEFPERTIVKIMPFGNGMTSVTLDAPYDESGRTDYLKTY